MVIDFKNSIVKGLILSLILLSCSKEHNTAGTKVYTHAITGLFNPGGYFIDNTIQGFNYAVSYEELKGLEMDVQFSSDSTLWMFHDVDLEGKTTGSGIICERSDEYMSGLRYLTSNQYMTKLVDVDLSVVQGEKEVFIDVKYVGACTGVVPSAQRLEQECLNFINHPKLTVSFIINNTVLAQEMSQLGYSVWSDAANMNEVNLSSPIYDGWFLRNNTISSSAVKEIIGEGKSIIIYENYSPGSIKDALSKGPSGILVEDVEEAILLMN